MKTNFQLAAMPRVAAVVLCFMLVSFSPLPGGDSYTILLNNKQVVQYYVYSKLASPSLTLDANSPNDQLSIFYSECGQIGTARKLSIRDDQARIMKEWSFADVKDEHAPMTVKIKDLSVQAGSKVNLYYASERVTKGMLLAHVTMTGRENRASR